MYRCQHLSRGRDEGDGGNGAPNSTTRARALVSDRNRDYSPSALETADSIGSFALSAGRLARSPRRESTSRPIRPLIAAPSSLLPAAATADVSPAGWRKRATSRRQDRGRPWSIFVRPDARAFRAEGRSSSTTMARDEFAFINRATIDHRNRRYW